MIHLSHAMSMLHSAQLMHGQVMSGEPLDQRDEECLRKVRAYVDAALAGQMTEDTPADVYERMYDEMYRRTG